MYAEVNGLSLYYEVHGDGRPLIALHGGFGTVGMYAPLLPALAGDRQVIPVELQGHGHTADIDRPLRHEHLADDIAALIGELGFEQVDLIGYSFGGGAALRTAIQHPSLIRRLIITSFPAKQAWWYPEVLAGMAQIGTDWAEATQGSPPHRDYVEVAPRPQDWPVLATKMGELLSRDYDWTGDLARITARMMLVFADADSVPPDLAGAFYRAIGGGERDANWDGSLRPAARLAIVPDRTHYDVLAAPGLADMIIRFLDAD
jgi:pimeloyl-ACP methyl ester carboxylesterase